MMKLQWWFSSEIDILESSSEPHLKSSFTKDIYSKSCIRSLLVSFMLKCLFWPGARIGLATTQTFKEADKGSKLAF